MLFVSKYLNRAGFGFNVVACAAIIAMILVSTLDVVLRFFNRPLPGAYELVGFLGTVVVSFALAFTSIEKGHIAVEIFVSRLPQRIQFGVDAFCSLVGTLLFGLISYQALVYALDIKKSGEVSLTLQMPVYPFIFGIAAGCGLLCLLLVFDTMKNIQRMAAR